MRFYLTGKYDDRRELQRKATQLEALGHVMVGPAWWMEREEGRSDGYVAEMALVGVKTSDVVIAVMDDADYAYSETFTELGCAIGLWHESIIVYNPHAASRCTTNVFYHYASQRIRHVARWQDVLDLLN